jgi:hypothetical protein
MSLSRQTIGALVDLVENKLSCMTVSDRDDLRDKVTLQRALSELTGMAGMNRDMEETNFGFVPRRGRRRRLVTESFA